MKPKTILIFLASAFLAACGGKTEINQEAKPVDSAGSQDEVQVTAEQARTAGIELGKIEYRQVSSTFKVNGVVDVPPQNMVSVSMPLGGYVKVMKLLPGMHVSKGQVLAVMEDPQYIQIQQDYLTAKARLSYTEKQYARLSTLNQSKATSDRALQESEAENRTQRVLVQSLTEKMRLLGLNPANTGEGKISRTVNIHSPIDGFVSKVLINPGKYVAPTDVLFELVDPRDIHLAITVFEKDLTKLYVGQVVTAHTNNTPEKKYRARIILIPRDLSADRSAEVHCHFDGYDKNLVPGTYMNAEIELLKHQMPTLPQDAIVRFESKHYVFAAVNKNTFKMLEVHPGATENSYTTFDEADSVANKMFVVKGAYSLLMKMKNVPEE